MPIRVGRTGGGKATVLRLAPAAPGTNLRRMRINEDDALAFINRNLSEGVAQFRADPEFHSFFAKVAQGEEIAAAEEYVKVTGASLRESHFAAVVAKNGRSPH